MIVYMNKSLFSTKFFLPVLKFLIFILSPALKLSCDCLNKNFRAWEKCIRFLSDHQYDPQQARSTGGLVAYAVHAWSSALESYGESRVISLDISKAFDRVWHKGLLVKLPMFGFHPTLITWIASFLSARSIAITIYGFLSRPHSINSGVPEGSVISPVLIIVVINDLFSDSFSVFN